MSCTKDEFTNQKERENVDFEERSNTNKVLVDFLELRDDHYFLNITKSEAKGLGISEESYLKTLKEIGNVNISLDSLRKEGLVVELTDPKKAVKSTYPETEFITRTTGTLTTDNNFSAIGSIWVAQGIKSFEFHCRHNSNVVAYYTCKVAPYNGQWEAMVQTGVYGTTTTIFVPYRFFSQSASIYFSTTDQKGGTAHYNGSFMD